MDCLGGHSSGRQTQFSPTDEAGPKETRLPLSRPGVRHMLVTYCRDRVPDDTSSLFCSKGLLRVIEALC